MCAPKRNVEDLMVHPKFGEQQMVGSSNTIGSAKDSSISKKQNAEFPRNAHVEHSISVRVEDHVDMSDMKMPASSTAGSSRKQTDSKKPKSSAEKPTTVDQKKQETVKSQKPAKTQHTTLRTPTAGLVSARTQLNSCKGSEINNKKGLDPKMVEEKKSPSLDSSQTSETHPAGNLSKYSTTEKTQMPSTGRAPSVISNRTQKSAPPSGRDASQKDRIKGWLSKFVKRKKQPEASISKTKETPVHSESCEETYDTQQSVVVANGPMK